MISVGEKFIIESIMSLTAYNNTPIIPALIDYRVNGLSGVKAAKKHGLPHRNTVYRASAHYEKLLAQLIATMPLLGFTMLFAKERDSQQEARPVAMNEKGDWFFIGGDGCHGRVELDFFVKVGERLVSF